MKIGHRLALGFVGLALLIVALGYVSLCASQAALKKAIDESCTTLVAQTLDEVQRTIIRRIENIQAHTTSPLIIKSTSRSNTDFENLPDSNGYIEEVEANWNHYENDKNTLCTRLCTNQLAQRLKTLRNSYIGKHNNPVFAEIFVTNKFGANVAQTNKTSDYYQADEQWWQVARSKGLFVGDVKYDESSYAFSMDIAAKIVDANGNFLGVIKAVLNTQETIDIINKAKEAAGYNTMQLHLMNKEAKIIYSTKHYTFLQDAYNQLIPRFGHFGQPGHTSCAVGEKGTDKGKLFAHAHSKGYGNFNALNWILLAEIESSEALAPISHLRNTMLAAGLAVMSLAMLASVIIYRSITIPLAKLQKATVQIAAGNLDTKPIITSKDEIGQFARSFQRMADQLKTTIADLNDEITGRKKTENKLHDNQHFLDSIFDNIQDGICVLDNNYNIIKANAWLEKNKQHRMPLVGKKCFEAFHNLNSPCPWCPSIKTMKTGQRHTAIIPVPGPEDPQQWIELTTFPLKDPEGNVKGVIEHIKEVTEQKKAESLLAERAEQIMHHHNALLQLANMPEQDFDSLLRIITEQDSQVLNVERVSIWLFTPDRIQLVCRDLFLRSKKVHKSGDSMNVKDYPSYFKVLKDSRIIAAGNAQTDSRTCEFTDSYLLPKGITSMMDVPIRLHGQITGIICHEHIGPARQWTGNEQDFAASVADMISLKLEAAERRKAEDALGKLNKDLETTVQELSRSNRQLQEFVHIAAHDLKTPLRGIGTLADWIVSDYGDKLDEHGREHVRLLKARVVRIDKLIEGILLFSKIVRSRKNERLVNLNTMLFDTIDRIKPPENVEIAVDSLPGIVCQPEHISQVFRNLLENAINFMDKPKGLVKVGCVDQGEFWKFYIQDNGPGLEHKHFERIFKIFQTLPKTKEPQTAGIGLAITRKTVELYGGKIWVESQPGSGCTFFFTLQKQQEESIYANATTHTAC